MSGKRSSEVVEGVPVRGELWVKGKTKKPDWKRGGKGLSHKDRGMPNKGSCELEATMGRGWKSVQWPVPDPSGAS